MDYHHHARLTVHSPEQLARKVLERRLSLREAEAVPFQNAHSGEPGTFQSLFAAFCLLTFVIPSR